MNPSDGSRCQNCNTNIYQGQRFCDNCGHRINHRLAIGTLCTGKTDGIPCCNVLNSRIKFCSSCGTENNSYLPDSITGKNIDRDNSLLSKPDADEEDKWEAHDIDLDIADDSTSKNDSNTILHQEEDVYQEDRWQPQNISYDAELYESYSKLKTDGKMEKSSYVRKKPKEVNTRILKFAVIGRSAVGKSSFINMMLDLQPGNKCYAETGAGDTTKNMYAYKHPKNESITFWDMPGFGTMEMTIEKFSSEFGFELNKFDYIFILIDTIVMEGDLCIVNKVKGYGTPYCFVRSKIDEDIKKGRTKEDIRQKLETSIQENDTVKGSALFLISNEKSCFNTGDFCALFSHITKHLPLAKAGSLSFFLPILSPEVIEQKFQSLQKRIKYVAASAGFIAASAGFIAAIPIPLLDIPVNTHIISSEIEKYYRIFLLDKNIVLNVPGVKHREFSKYFLMNSDFTFWKMYLKIGVICAVLSKADIIRPVILSAVFGGALLINASTFLNQTLIEMKKDALSVYEHYTFGK